MSTISFGIGGISDGAGFQLFVQSNNSDGIYADAAARDAYFSANQPEVDRLTENEFLIIKLTDDGSGAIAYQQYQGVTGSYSASSWTNVTSLIQGPQGISGDATDLSAFTIDGQVARYRSSDGKLFPSTANQNADGSWNFQKSIEVPAGSIDVGQVIKISEGVSTLVLYDKLNGINSFPVVSNFSNSTGSQDPLAFDFGAEQNLNIVDEFDTTLTDNPLDFGIGASVVAPNLRMIKELTFKTGAAMTNVRFRITDFTSGKEIRYIPSKAAFDGLQTGLDIGVGDVVFNLLNEGTDTTNLFHFPGTPFLMTPNQAVNIRVVADSVNILADGLNDPYLQAKYHDGPLRNLYHKTEDLNDGRVPRWDDTSQILADSSLLETFDHVQIDKPIRFNSSTQLQATGSELFLTNPTNNRSYPVALGNVERIDTISAVTIQRRDAGVPIIYSGNAVLDISMPTIIDAVNTPPENLGDFWGVHIINESQFNINVNVSENFESGGNTVVISPGLTRTIYVFNGEWLNDPAFWTYHTEAIHNNMTESGQIPKWDNGNKRFTVGALLEVNQEIQSTKAIRIPGSQDEGLKFSGFGEIHNGIGSEIYFTDSSNRSRSLLRGVANYHLVSASQYNLDNESSDFIEVNVSQNESWNLPKINLTVTDRASVSYGHYYDLLNKTAFTVTLTTNTTDVFSDDTSTHDILPNTFTRLTVGLDSKWQTAVIPIGGGGSSDLTAVSDLNIPRKDQANDRLVNSGISLVEGTTDTYKFANGKVETIGTNKNTGISFLNRGDVYTNSDNDIFYEDANSNIYSLTHGSDGIVVFSDAANKDLSSNALWTRNGTVFYYINAGTTTWTLPGVFSGYGSTTVNFGTVLTFYNPVGSGAITFNLNSSFPLNEIYVGTSSVSVTTFVLQPNTKAEFYVRDDGNSYQLIVTSSFQLAPTGSGSLETFSGVVGEVGLIEGQVVTQKHLTVGVNEAPAIFSVDNSDIDDGFYISGVIKGVPSQTIGDSVTVAFQDDVVVALNLDTDAELAQGEEVYLNVSQTGKFFLWGSLGDTYAIAGRVLESISTVSGFRYYSVYVNMQWINQTFRNTTFLQAVASSGTTQLFSNREVSVSLLGGNVTLNMPTNPMNHDTVLLHQLTNIGSNILTFTDTANLGFRIQNQDGTVTDDTSVEIASNLKTNFEFIDDRWWIN